MEREEVLGMKIHVTRGCPEDRIILIAEPCFDEITKEIIPERVAIIKVNRNEDV